LDYLQSITFTQNANGVVLKLPSPNQNETDRVIVLAPSNH